MERYTPYVRYTLIFMSSWLIASGNLPAPVALIVEQMSLDPVIVADVAGVLSGLAALLWYHVSRARKALEELRS